MREAGDSLTCRLLLPLVRRLAEKSRRERARRVLGTWRSLNTSKYYRVVVIVTRSLVFTVTSRETSPPYSFFKSGWL